jgi:hypothetical protein
MPQRIAKMGCNYPVDPETMPRSLGCMTHGRLGNQSGPVTLMSQRSRRANAGGAAIVFSPEWLGD